METFDGFIGEFSADIVSKQYKDLEGIKNNTYMANVVAGDKWWTKKYFSYMKDKPMNMANISDITFDTTEVNNLPNKYTLTFLIMHPSFRVPVLTIIMI